MKARRPPTRSPAVVLALALAVWWPAATAVAQTASEVAEAIEFRGYYVESGLDVSIDVLEDLVDRHPDVGFVALAGSPDQGADLFAEEVLSAIEEPDTVVVLTETDVGVVSADYRDAEIDGALDSAFATTGDTYEVDFEQVAAALAGEPVLGEDGSSSGGSGGSQGGFPVWTVVVVLFGLGMWWMLRSNRKSTERIVERRVETARNEIRSQMSVIANEILELSDRVDQSTHPEAMAHYRSASAAFGEAEAKLERAATESDLEELADELDEARWELAAAEALVEGRDVPSRPEESKPPPCFFDPTHGAGVEEARLETATGERTVMVCRADAERLRRGEQPEPRTIDVGGRQVPAPQAPRTHGGSGMDWLDAFSIFVGGMSAGRSYRWGRPRGGFGGFGGGFGGMGRRSGGFGLPSGRGRSFGSGGRSRSVSRSVGRGRRGR